jgi:hypothetical protein
LIDGVTADQENARGRVDAPHLCSGRITSGEVRTRCGASERMPAPLDGELLESGVACEQCEQQHGHIID